MDINCKSGTLFESIEKNGCLICNYENIGKINDLNKILDSKKGEILILTDKDISDILAKQKYQI